MPLTRGSRLDFYEIIASLGAGGMGEVYRARDTALKRDVAIKVLRFCWSHDPEHLRRFEFEAQAAAALNHPNIVSIFHIGRHDGSPYIVTELLQGETLRERLHRSPLPLREVLDVGIGAAQGLAAACAAGIIHRDLKPENIFLTKDGRVKILDFGLAKLDLSKTANAEDETATLQLQTSPGEVLGTIGYMSPEQVRGEAADARTDIFALGLILYEMLTGRRAFQKPTSAETMSAILNEEPSPISQLAPATPPALQHVVHRCFEKNADKRFQNASDLGFALEALSDSSGLSVPAKLQVSSTRRWSWRTGMLLAAFIVAFVAAFWFLSSGAGLRRRADPSAVLPMRLELRLPGASFFALSPNGEQIAYTAPGADGRSLIWIRALNSLDARALPGSEEAGLVFWSFDSRYVGFQADNKLKKVDVTGAKLPQVICEAPEFVLGGAWNQADVIVFGTTEGVKQVSAAGGVPRFVTGIHATHYNDAHVFPSFLPNGRQFVYLGVGQDPGIYVASLDVKPEEQSTKRIVETRVMSGFVSPHNGAPGRLLFMRDDSLYAQDFDAKRLALTGEPVPLARGVSKYLLSADFSASETGVLAYRTGGFGSSRLSWFDRHGKELGDLHESAPSSHVQDLSLSPDGTHLATTRISRTATDLGVALWVTDLPRGVSTRLSFEPVPQGSPAWSADGRYLAFSTTRPDGMAIIEKPFNGSGAEHLLVRASPDEKYPNDWSDHAQALLYTRQEPGKDTGLWLADLTGETDRPAAVRPFIDTSFNEGQGQFSPDGRWIAYASDESGRSEVYVQSFIHSREGGTRTQVSRDGGHDPRWRRDGRELFYLSNEGKLMSVKVRSGSTFQAEAPQSLFQVQDFHRIANGFGLFNWAVSPDGERFLIARDPPPTEPISIVLNWPAEMTK
jgi:dipeptidyl aminopeptidase/acylaminoacyl peptidase